MIDTSSTATRSKASISLSTGESQVTRTEHPSLTLIDITICIFFIHTPIIGIHRIDIRQCVFAFGIHGHFTHPVRRSAYMDMILHGTGGHHPCEFNCPVIAIHMYIVVRRIRIQRRRLRIRLVKHQCIDKDTGGCICLSLFQYGRITDGHMLPLHGRKLHIGLSGFRRFEFARRLLHTRQHHFTIHTHVYLCWIRLIAIRHIVVGQHRVFARRQSLQHQIQCGRNIGQHRSITIAIQAIHRHTITDEFRVLAAHRIFPPVRLHCLSLGTSQIQFQCDSIIQRQRIAAARIDRPRCIAHLRHLVSTSSCQIEINLLRHTPCSQSTEQSAHT